MKHYFFQVSYLVKQAYVNLKQKPIFSLSVITTMGITLGALIAVITLAYVMLIKPLPYPDQERLYRVEHQLISNDKKIDGRAFTYPNLMHLFNKQSVFDEGTLIYFDGAVLTSSATEPMVAISYITPQWFDLFNTKMALGRAFEKSEQLNSYNPVAILSYQTWLEEFNGAANILEQSLSLSGINYQIIGVLEQDNIELPLAGPGFKSQLYIPWDFNSISHEQRKRWGNDDGNLLFIGKLNVESTLLSPTQLNQKLTILVNENWQRNVTDINFFKGWSINLQVESLKDFIIADNKRSIYLLLIGALGLFIIACANIANLFVSRTVERQQELAICAAIGASKAQLFSTILSETALLMVLAIGVSQCFVLIVFSIMHNYLSDFLPRVDELSINAVTLAVSLFLLVLLTLTYSHICRQMINYRKLNNSLQSSGKGNGVQVSKRVRNILISSQIGVATILVFINIALYKDAAQLIKQPLGYQTKDITSIVLALPNVERDLRAQTVIALKYELSKNPKIIDVSQSMRPSGFGTTALRADTTNKRYTAQGKDIDERYFPMIEQTLVEGENFSVADIKDDNDVMIVNEVFAKRLAPMGSVIGFTFNEGTRIIGVVKSINIPGRQSIESRFYYPASLARNMLLIKVKAGQVFSRDEMMMSLKKVSNKLSLFSFTSLDEYKSQRLFAAKATAYTTITVTVLTLFLSGIGLYGILSYSTQMRRFEIGTRLAIGAKGSDMVKLIIKDNANAILLGITASIVILATLALVFSEYLSEQLNWQLLPILLLTLVMNIVISLFACYLPLRQYINKPAIYSLKGSE